MVLFFFSISDYGFLGGLLGQVMMAWSFVLSIGVPRPFLFLTYLTLCNTVRLFPFPSFLLHLVGKAGCLEVFQGDGCSFSLFDWGAWVFSGYLPLFSSIFVVTLE